MCDFIARLVVVRMDADSISPGGVATLCDRNSCSITSRIGLPCGCRIHGYASIASKSKRLCTDCGAASGWSTAAITDSASSPIGRNT
ncbi:hypothetical protein D3C73_1221930 [compost metagenome]